MEDIELKISSFIDGEMHPDDQAELFKALSLNESARNAFNDLLKIKNGVREHYSSMKPEMPELKLPQSESVNKEGFYRKMFYFSAAAALVVLFGSAFLISNLTNAQKEINSLKQNYMNISNEFKMFKKNNDLQKSLLFTENKTATEKGIVKFAAINKTEKIKTGKNAQDKYRDLQDGSREKVITVEITKKDFLTSQMIGN